MRLPRWAPHALSLELRKFFSYRVDFWLQFLGGTGSWLLVFYFLWKAVFSATGATQLGGYTLDQMILYYLLVPLVDRCVRGQEFGAIAQEIYDGSLTRYLVYPLPVLGYKYISTLAVSIIGLLQFLLGLGLYFLFMKTPEGMSVNPMSIVMGITLMAVGSILYFLMSSCLEFVAFWAENVWSLQVMLRFIAGIFGGSLLPLTLFPQWVQPLLKALPFAYLTFLPVRALTGQATLTQWTEGISVLALWSVVFYFLSRFLLKRGLYRYTGVGI